MLVSTRRCRHGLLSGNTAALPLINCGGSKAVKRDPSWSLEAIEGLALYWEVAVPTVRLESDW
jgi:hypothetical protein